MTSPGGIPAVVGDRLCSPREPWADAPERLALGMLQATEAAALACAPLRESGDPTALLVAVQRSFDNAPCTVPAGCEVVVAPVAGALPGVPGCGAVLAGMARRVSGGVPAAHGGGMTMLGVRREAGASVDVRLPLAANLARLAVAVGKPVAELVVVLPNGLDHMHLAAQVWAAGSRMIQVAGSVIGAALSFVLLGDMADMVVGRGDGPQGAIAASVMDLTGGHAQAASSLQLGSDRYTASCHGVVVATGLTDGVLAGPYRGASGWWTRSLVITGRQPAVLVSALHRKNGTVARLFERLFPCRTS